MGEILELTDGLIIDYRAREWCKLPYPNHPKGCPNYGKRPTCPPAAPLIDTWLCGMDKMWFVCVPFNLEKHIGTMLVKHPNWTERQARCLLYWQPKVNKELRLETYSFAKGLGYNWTYCPEAMGVNVIQTAQSLGLPLEVKPRKLAYKISLVAGG